MSDLELHEQVEKANISLVELGEGISSVVILVSLLRSLSEEMEELIYNLSDCYIREDDPQFQIHLREW